MRWLLVCAMFSVCVGQCPVTEPPVISSVTKDRGALGSLLDTAKATRESVTTDELPFSAIRAEISRVYNRSALNLTPFIDLWLGYTQNHLYISSFVLVAGVAFPLTVVVLWLFWEYCHGTDSEGDEDNRHSTLLSQVLTWSLAISVFLLLLLLCVFLVVLIAGNTMLSSGVQQGGGAVGVVLPEAARVRDEALDRLDDLLVTEYQQLLHSVEENVLSLVGPGVAVGVRSETQASKDTVYQKVQREIELANNAVALKQDILTHLNSPSLSISLTRLNSSLSNLTAACNAVGPLNNALSAACTNITSLSDSALFPRLCVGIQGAWSLVEVMSELSATVSEITGSQEIDTYDQYLDVTLADYLNEGTRLVTVDNIGPASLFGQTLSTFRDHTLQYYNTSLTFDLPRSQKQLEEFLGSRYLGNWEALRYACTLTFALFVLALGVCLLVPIGRGLLSVLAIYKGGDDLTHLEGAHQAGTTLKKVALMFMVVSFVTSVTFGFFLSVGGVLGQTCGIHGNLSAIVTNVIDHPDTWRGMYPLAGALVKNSTYPLTVQSVLDHCHDNLSLYQTFQLGAKLDLSVISFIEQNVYQREMRDIANDLPVFHSLTPSLDTLLTQLDTLRNTTDLPVQWDKLQGLSTESLFELGFVGLAELKHTVQSLISTLQEIPSFDVGGVTPESLSAILTSTEHALSNLSTHIDDVLAPSVMSNSTMLRNALSSSKAGLVTNESESLSRNVSFRSTAQARRELSLAFTTVLDNLTEFTNNTQQSLTCHTGSCLSLALRVDQFTSALCDQVVPGLDVYWSSLLAILTLSLLILPLSMVLAGRLIDPELNKTLSNKFHYWGSVFRQVRALCWLCLSLGVALWLLVSVATDTYFIDTFCDSTTPLCCVPCVWAVGVVFLLSTAVVGGASHIYQCVLIHRITKSIHGKVKRLWVNRKKAIQFYTQLLILVIQDVPFLIIAGVYASPPNTVTVPALFTIVASLTGILAYIVYLIQERSNILTYFTWLKKAVVSSKLCKRTIEERPTDITANGQSNGGIAMTTIVRRGRYGSSESEQSDDSQGTTQQDGEWQFSGSHRLANIPEQPEVLESVTRSPPVLSSGSPGARALPQPIHIPHLDDDESYTELSQAQPVGMVPLDHLDPSNETSRAVRREAAPMVGGVEIAPCREFSTPTSSDFGSSFSMSDYHGYMSSQLHEEDYRDDYSDSDCSQLASQRSRHTLRLVGVSGEVSMDV